MRALKVDEYGIRIMVPKAITHLVMLDPVSNITANILKQEMLSLGGDAAVARGALTGETRKTGCLLIGNLAQFGRLSAKLKKQPFGLNPLSKEISAVLDNYSKNEYTFDCGKHRIKLSGRTAVMGIVNVTPDSFSGDGYLGRDPLEIADVISKMIDDGADMIDIGGESTRPGAAAVSAQEELARVIPVIRIATRRFKVPVSVDTRKPQVAKAALDNGAAIINDISGLRDPGMAKLAARYKAGVVIMHMKGEPRTMHLKASYVSIMDELIGYFCSNIGKALEAGIKRGNIVIDPGIGFAKTKEHNLEVLKRLSEMKIFGLPILVGTSRKSFIGKILNAEARDRISGTLASCVLAARSGAKILRVHDVKEAKQALSVFDSINNS